MVGNTVAYLLGKIISQAGHTHTRSEITNFPSSLPASDVYSWAKQPNKPSYNYSEVGAAAANHSHSQYASVSTVNSLTNRVTTLEGCVDMAKLVHTEYVSDYCRGTLTTYTNADYVVITGVIYGQSGRPLFPGEVGRGVKIMKGCKAQCLVGNTEPALGTSIITYASNGAITATGGNNDKVEFNAEFYKY